MRDHFIERLIELAAEHRRIVLVTGDLGFGVFDEYRATHSQQFINAGVAEQNMTALATGLAMEGKVVFTYSIGNFATMRCLEQIRNDACYHNANVKVVSIGGGYSYGALGFSHHLTEDLAVLRSIPGLTVIAPCGPWETSEATSAIARHEGPGYLRLDKSSGDDRPQAGETFAIGKARVLRDGCDITMIVCGGILEEVQAAAETLARLGVQARIVSMHTVKPLDVRALESAVNETGGIVTVEEHTLRGGLGGAIAEYFMDAGVRPARFRRIAINDNFSSIVGSQHYLRKVHGIDAPSIVAEVRDLVSGK